MDEGTDGRKRDTLQLEILPLLIVPSFFWHKYVA
jgi:hypothetical protein